MSHETPKAAMKLVKFRVKNFRSVDDSGWIDVDSLAALIGTNESGKTNLLVPLWKLKPAKGGEIRPTADYPRKSFTNIRAMEKKPIFIEAQFAASDELAAELANLSGVRTDDVRAVRISRDLGGGYHVAFPEAKIVREAEAEKIHALLDSAQEDISGIDPLKGEARIKIEVEAAISAAKATIESTGPVALTSLREVHRQVSEVEVSGVPKTGKIAPRLRRLELDLASLRDALSHPHPQSSAETQQKVLESMPSFVYYSSYGNLDSEIYLPHVIEDLQRDDLGAKLGAKARTLNVLFDFVDLSPEEILELGRDFPEQGGKPSDEDIKGIAEKKKERDILLQSAGTKLTKSFREWWQQGEYRFRFQADGDHFRIWVSDDVRPEDIELEGRSTGLQWFLSFYLVFLVERQDAHQGAILLLDEPGHSLHPLAQEDLSNFFENLSDSNQLIYTTHSPFLVSPDRLDRVNAVYVDDNGATAVSADLHAGKGNGARARSIYPVFAALGLSASSPILEGCQVVVVEGPSDQFYLSAIKNQLIANGAIKPMREVVFLPAGGVKGIKAVAAVVTAKDESLPFVIVDDDSAGRELAASLGKSLYAGFAERILNVADFTAVEGSEIEDLWPVDALSGVLDRYLRGDNDQDFSDFLKPGQPIVPQVKEYAGKHGVNLESPGWKAEVAKRAKNQLLRRPELITKETPAFTTWTKLFERITGAS
jgi:AAA domain, putative AbiEii toxin, Type IV TA system/AAA ATPase domain